MTQLGKSFVIGLVAASLLVGGCASRNAQEQSGEGESEQIRSDENTVATGHPRDPFESVNRQIWDFNWEVFDAYFFRPLTVGYVTVMPQFARTGLLNAANNLEEPANFANNLFQGKVDAGMNSLARFILNSTVGLLGIIDVAEKIGIRREEEQFGEVLAVWGAQTGPYLMLPAAGPNDVRSFSGDLVDSVYYPLTILNTNFSIARFLVSALEGRAALIDQEQQLEQAIDDYAFVRNAYFENLEYRVTDGASGDKAIEEEQLENFEEFESMLGEIEMGDGSQSK